MTLRPRTIACLRWLLLSLAAIATLAAVFVTEENWRADRDWAAAQRELAARGDRLDFEAYLPKSVPAASNLFKLPLLAGIFADEQPKAREHLLAALGMDHQLDTVIIDNSVVRKRRAGVLDFNAIRQEFIKEGLILPPYSEQPAADVLRGLAPLRPALLALRRGAKERPEESFDEVTLANHSMNAGSAFTLMQILGFQVETELQAGHQEEAWADDMILFRMTRGFTNTSATLIETMVGLAGFGISTEPLREALQTHAWSEAQLAAIQGVFEEFRPLESLERNMRLERAVVLYAVDHDTPTTRALWPSWIFRGLAEQNKTNFARDSTDCFSSLEPGTHRVLTSRVDAIRRRMALIEKSRSPYRSLERLALPTFERLIPNAAGAANTIDQAVCAIALERYRLGHGEYPPGLQDLVPGFLPAVPHDVFDGQAMRYSRAPDGSFWLYSVGSAWGQRLALRSN